MIKSKSNKIAFFWLRFFTILIVLIIITFGIIILFRTIAELNNNNLTKNLVEESQEKITPIFDNGSIAVHFCQTESCLEQMLKLIASANQSINCAFFDLDNQELQKSINIAVQRNVFTQIVIDGDNKGKLSGDIFKFETRKAYMHNKFCIFDNKVILTGSMNPTDNDIYKNDNNLVIINSSKIAENYNNEFEELWNGNFGKGNKVKYPEIIFNQNQNQNQSQNQIGVENYFCPEDDCKKQTLKTLSNANKSIFFMTYSFTDDEIGKLLLQKRLNGIDIKGVFDTLQAGSKYSQYHIMLKNNITVVKDKNKKIMHHKVFIIDNTIVITGSYNPSENADKSNDENILIIHNIEIARKYIDEFERVFSLENFA